jgi:carbon monoxide dehydrogenase subunit G
MSSPGENEFLIKSAVKYSYAVNGKHEDIFEYLSNIRMLLVNIPYVTRVQLQKNKGLARLYCSMPVLAFKMRVVVDIETNVNYQERLISFYRPANPLDIKPEGYISGTFGANIEIIPKEDGNTRISSGVTLGFDSGQFELLKMFPRSFLESAGEKMLQNFVEQTSQNYVNKIAKDFPRWLKQRESVS